MHVVHARASMQVINFFITEDSAYSEDQVLAADVLSKRRNRTVRNGKTAVR